MIIIGLEDCADCKSYSKDHPDYEYIELPKRGTKSSDRIREIKKALTKLKFDKEVPALLNDDLTELTLRSIIVPDEEPVALLSLAQPSITPPGGFKYVDADTGQHFDDHILWL